MGWRLGHIACLPDRKWQNPDNVYAPSVMRLMAKVEHVVHPEYENSLTADRASRPTRVEVRARGQVFATERSYPRGSGQPGSNSYIELIEKFRVNAKGVISDVQANELVDLLMRLETIDDVGKVMQLTSR